MLLALVPLFLIIFPFILLAAGTYYAVNRLVKKSNALRPIAFILCLISGGVSIVAGYKLMDTFLISPFIIMAMGGLLILIGGTRSLFTSKKAIIIEEIQSKMAEEKQNIKVSSSKNDDIPISNHEVIIQSRTFCPYCNNHVIARIRNNTIDSYWCSNCNKILQPNDTYGD